MEEELDTLAQYTLRAFIALALGGASHYDALLSGQHYKEKH